MKQFFKFMFASFLGMVTFCIFSIILLIIIIASASGNNDKSAFVPKNSVLQITLEYPIKDRTSSNPFQDFDFSSFQIHPQIGLDKILENIKKAKNDDRIKGIYLDLTTINTGIASVEEIRKALEDFKTSKKWIISYAEIYTQKTYYLASVADKIYLNPAGIMELRGISSQLMFFKNMLDKLGVDVQIIRHGKFKSAVEPFMLDKMSDANRKQMNKLLATTWNSMLEAESKSRNISVKEINLLADSIKIQDAKDALKYGFVDKLMYKDELIDDMHKRLDIKTDEEIKFVSLPKYTNAKIKGESKEKTKSDNQIAVIYASGDIVSGKSEDGKMGSETISKAIRDARLDEKVKAIVLRVNSPGGSALASDVIWREVVLAKKAKPVIVSMGDVAASGGYYISCAANKIVASEKTITGSIGVFGIIPNAKSFFNNKLGITFDTVKTNTHSDIMTIFRPLTADEKNIIQIGVEKVYDQFITKVADGRGLTKVQVDSIGQGRVWSGKDAIKVGLVDKIGGLTDAIKMASEMAKINDFETVAYPIQKNSAFNDILLNISDDAETKILENKLGVNYKYYQKLEKISTQQGILARMPFEIDIY